MRWKRHNCGILARVNILYCVMCYDHEPAALPGQVQVPYPARARDALKPAPGACDRGILVERRRIVGGQQGAGSTRRRQPPRPERFGGGG